MQVTARYHFSAAHRLDTPALTPEQNRELYGRCNNPYGHGHDYVLDVTVDGPVDANGLIVNRAQLERFVRGAVVEKLDQRYLNVDLAEFGGRVPTTENLALVIHEMLAAEWPLAARLVRIQIEETARNTIVWES
jgi:6-pyruvoyltetrahydropterin/6-carboxytetrahydropterin synthase